MKKLLQWRLLLLSVFLYFPAAFAAQEVVNVYTWANWISPRVVRQFEKETGIKVNLSSYDNNETLYAKLKASKNPGYDVIAPSSFFVKRMAKEGLLEKIDKKALSNFGNLDKHFLKKDYDPQNEYSIPFAWGLTGIFYNSKYFPEGSIRGWEDLWDSKYRDKLLLMDDPRDVIPVALVTLGHSMNDTQPEHLQAAYLKLKKMMPNVKLFNLEAITSILIDEDATVGMAWNGDVFRARQENPNIQFVFPREGFLIWLDCLALAKKAPHAANAHRFINFILRPDIAAWITLDYGFATANRRSLALLPPEIRNNPIINPPPELLDRGELQKAISDESMQIYEKYWERLKMAG